MKLIKPSWEIIKQGPGLEGIYEMIELAGRTCYKSTRKEGTTAKDFVDRMIASKHLSMLEHGTVYLTVPYNSIIEYADSQNPYYRDILCNPWVKYVIDYENDVVYISSNYRWIIENNLENWLQYLCEPTEFHEKRVTVRFIADIHFYKDITRHRLFSWAIESTRYCNYLKEKFGMSVSFMKPSWIKEEDILELEEDCKVMESIYFKWINKGYQAQHAAYFLPQGTKAEVVMTGFISNYKHFFQLRTSIIAETGMPHLDVSTLVDPVYKAFIRSRYI